MRDWVSFPAGREPFYSFVIAFAVVGFFAWQFPLPEGTDVPVEETPAETAWVPESEPPVELISVEPTIPPAAVDEPVETMETVEAPAPWLEYRIRRNDTMERILRSIKTDETMRQFLLTQKLKSYRRLRVGDTVYFRLDDSGHLQELLYKTDPAYYLTAGKDEFGVAWAKEEPPQLVRHSRRVHGRIDSSLFLAAEKAGMSDMAIERLIEALEPQIDFYRNVRKGDTFRVIYDIWHDEDEVPVKVGNIEIFEYVNHLGAKPRVIRGIRHPEKKRFFSYQGESLLRAFLPAPLKYRRVSSRFSLRRFHPVLKRWRPHRGVDYAARSGTPVRSTADGTVITANRQRGYGNVIMIKHYNIYTTVYAHLRSFAKGIRRGKRVMQGEVIGYVGQTGLATGPHLHYEFRVKNVHKDPLSVDLPRQVPALKGEELKAFQEHAQPWVDALERIPSGE